LFEKKALKEVNNNQKMTSEEDRGTGFVKFSVYLDYFKYNGGYIFAVMIIISILNYYNNSIRHIIMARTRCKRS